MTSNVLDKREKSILILRFNGFSLEDIVRMKLAKNRIDARIRESGAIRKIFRSKHNVN